MSIMAGKNSQLDEITCYVEIHQRDGDYVIYRQKKI